MADWGRRRGRERIPIGIDFQHARQSLGDRFALECPLASEHLIEDRAERPDVGAAIDELAARPVPATCKPPFPG